MVSLYLGSKFLKNEQLYRSFYLLKMFIKIKAKRDKSLERRLKVVRLL